MDSNDVSEVFLCWRVMKAQNLYIAGLGKVRGPFPIRAAYNGSANITGSALEALPQTVN